MITVIIKADGRADALARTIRALIPGVVAGLVGSCVIYGCSESDTDTNRIADAAGALVFDSGRVAEAVSAARGEWLLILEPGARPRGDWVDALRSHIEDGDGAPARFRNARKPANPLFTLLSRPRPLLTGLFLSRQQAFAIVGSAGSLDRLMPGRKLRLLDAEIVPANR